MGDAFYQGVATVSTPKPAGLVSTVPLSPDLAMLIPSPINVCTLNHELHDYDPDKALALLNGFTYGFLLYYSGEPLASSL